MNLRLRLLLLIAVLLTGVLAASLGVIHRNLSRQIHESARAALKVAEAHFRLLEERRKETLEVAATALEQEPGFRNVLRTHDQPTIQDYLQLALEAYRVDLLLVAGPNGQLEASSLPLSVPPPGLQRALEGEAGGGYWVLEGKLFQVAFLPMGAADRLAGALAVGLEVDQDLVQRLAQDTGCQVTLSSGQLRLASGPTAAGQPGEAVSAVVKLGSAGELELSRETSEAQEQVARLTRWLVGLGGGALGLALVVSYPLLGRISNPVEALAHAEARLQAVVDANVDGLIALDPQGRVSFGNPAAARALGQDLEELSGVPLEGLVDNETADALLAEPEGRLSQTAVFEREGRRFRMQRTFLGRAAPGSLLVIRDITHERDWEARTAEFFSLLSERLKHRGPGFERNLDNLAVLADHPLARPGPVELEPLLRELDSDAQLTGELECVYAPADDLRLVLVNLLDNARRYGEEARLEACRDGGAVEIRVVDAGPGVEETRRHELTDASYPKRGLHRKEGVESGLGLGLYVSRTLLLAMGSRLQYVPGRFSFWLPQAPS